MINNTIIRSVDIQNGLNEPFNTIEQDTNSRFLTIYLTNGNAPQDLTGCQVFLQTSFQTTLGTSNVENEGQIKDATNGIVALEITSNMTPKPKTNQEFQIVLRKVNGINNNDRLTFPKFYIQIGDRVIDGNGENTIMAVNESTVVDNLNEVNVNLQTTINKIGNSSDSGNTPTLFGEIQRNYDYMNNEIIEELNNIEENISNGAITSSTRKKTFFTAGTFEIPTGIETIYVTAIAEGGSGSQCTFVGINNVIQRGGYGGASGEWCIKRPIDVRNTSTIYIQTGRGNTYIRANSEFLITLLRGINGGFGMEIPDDSNMARGGTGVSNTTPGTAYNGFAGYGRYDNIAPSEQTRRWGIGGGGSVGLSSRNLISNKPELRDNVLGAGGGGIEPFGMGGTSTFDFESLVVAGKGYGSGGAGGSAYTLGTTAPYTIGGISGDLTGRPGIVIIEW